MRTYRLIPAILAVIAFLVVANLLLGWMVPEPPQPTPEDDMWLVYFAVVHAGDPPQELDDSGLRTLLGRLDPALEPLADRVTVRSYTRKKWGFELVASHDATSSEYRITADGVY
jgi:hypothetical protein